MKTRLAFAAIALASLALVGGCKSNAKKTETASASPASMGMLNTKCPLMPDHPIDPTVTTAYGEGKVGFCCKGCVPQWNKLTDEQKAARLAKSK
jgi:hypothetical protein